MLRDALAAQGLKRMDFLTGFAILMPVLGLLVVRRFWKVRPKGAPPLSVVSFWSMPVAAVVGTWLLAADYLIAEYAPESSTKRATLLVLGSLFLIDGVALMIVAPVLGYFAKRATRRDG